MKTARMPHPREQQQVLPDSNQQQPEKKEEQGARPKNNNSRYEGPKVGAVGLVHGWKMYGGQSLR